MLCSLSVYGNYLECGAEMKDFFIKIGAILLGIAAIAGLTFLFMILFSKDNSKPANAVVITQTQAQTDTEIQTEQQTETEVNEEPETETTVLETEFDPQSTSPNKSIVTAREPKEYDNNSVYISMQNILQNPELPVGCEITALTINLRYLGFNADKVTMAKDYLPISPWGNSQYIDGELYKDSFFDYFIGDPFSKGYGCFSNAIEKAANKYIADNGGGYTVKNISGSEPDVLYDYLAQDIPVICWATDGMIEPEYYESWRDNETGDKLDWYLNEHCFVLAGFDMENDLVTLNDPMKGIIDYNKTKFEKRYVQMYSQAIVILKDEQVSEPSETQVPDNLDN